MKSLDGEPRFPMLYKLIGGRLSILCSNDDAEQGISVLINVYINQRSNLDQSTIIWLMSIKFNCDSCCSDAKFSEELLKVKESYIFSFAL